MVVMDGPECRSCVGGDGSQPAPATAGGASMARPGRPRLPAVINNHARWPANSGHSCSYHHRAHHYQSPVYQLQPSLAEDRRPEPVKAESATRPSEASPAPPPSGAWVRCQVRTRIPTRTGAECYVHLYTNSLDNKEHMAFVFGSLLRSESLDAIRAGESTLDRVKRGAYVSNLTTDAISPASESIRHTKVHHRHASHHASSVPQVKRPSMPKLPLVRIHSECFTGETMGSVRCDCGEQLEDAMQRMSREGSGIVVYLRQEGRNIGLLDKLRAYNLQDLGHDTVTANALLDHPADGRTYGVASLILRDLQTGDIRLLTNNPDKVEQLEAVGIRVAERVGMVPKHWQKHPRSRCTDSPLAPAGALTEGPLRSAGQKSQMSLKVALLGGHVRGLNVAGDSGSEWNDGFDSQNEHMSLKRPSQGNGAADAAGLATVTTSNGTGAADFRALDSDDSGLQDGWTSEPAYYEMDAYLRTKALRMRHMIEFPAGE